MKNIFRKRFLYYEKRFSERGSVRTWFS